MRGYKNKVEDWNKLQTDEAYKLKQAEFQGATIQALQDIREDIKEIKDDKNIRSYISYGISALIGGLAAFTGHNLKLW